MPLPSRQVVYDNGPVADPGWESFDDLRKRVASEWKAAPPKADNISDQLKEVSAAKSSDALSFSSAQSLARALMAPVDQDFVLFCALDARWLRWRDSLETVGA